MTEKETQEKRSLKERLDMGRGQRLFDIKPGMTFNYLTTIEYIPGGKGQRQKWLCRCVCGAIVKVEPSALRHNRAVSCGCRQRKRKKKVTSETLRQMKRLAEIPGPTPTEIKYGF